MEYIIIYIILMVLVLIVAFLFYYFSNIRNNHDRYKYQQLQEEIKPTDVLDNENINTDKRSPQINYEKAIKDFNIAIREYEKLIKNYKYHKYEIGTNETVYNIENNLVVYIGVSNWNGYGVDTSIPRFHVLIEELTYNNLFKFNATQFGTVFYNSHYDIRVIRFYGLKGLNYYNEIGATKFFYVNKSLPQLNLLDRAQNWEGAPCHFIIVELYDENGSAATIKYITNENLEKEAQSFCRQIEQFKLKQDTINKITNNKIIDKLVIMEENYKNEKQINQNLIWTLRGHLRYFFVSERTTDYDLQGRGAQLLENYNNGLIENIKWQEYGRFDGKWKSEFLVFEYCQKLYGVDNVLFQYSPDFLGHMSYDVFIISKNTAIEYQGKQHFEPVEFFGGEDHFKKQIERDNKKKELSKRNGVKLIYINYNEVITENLITERVEN